MVSGIGCLGVLRILPLRAWGPPKLPIPRHGGPVLLILPANVSCTLPPFSLLPRLCTSPMVVSSQDKKNKTLHNTRHEAILTYPQVRIHARIQLSQPHLERETSSIPPKTVVFLVIIFCILFTHELVIFHAWPAILNTVYAQNDVSNATGIETAHRHIAKAST